MSYRSYVPVYDPEAVEALENGFASFLIYCGLHNKLIKTFSDENPFSPEPLYAIVAFVIRNDQPYDMRDGKPWKGIHYTAFFRSVEYDGKKYEYKGEHLKTVIQRALEQGGRAIINPPKEQSCKNIFHLHILIDELPEMSR